MTKNLQIMRYGAYAFIHENSQVLLTEKSYGPYKGLWGLPGGAIEFGETPEETLQREIKEETAYSAQNFQLLTVVTDLGEYIEKEIALSYHHLGLIYQAELKGIIPGAIAEENIRWMDLKTIDLNQLAPLTKHLFERSILMN